MHAAWHLSPGTAQVPPAEPERWISTVGETIPHPLFHPGYRAGPSPLSVSEEQSVHRSPGSRAGCSMLIRPMKEQSSFRVMIIQSINPSSIVREAVVKHAKRDSRTELSHKHTRILIAWLAASWVSDVLRPAELGWRHEPVDSGGVCCLNEALGLHRARPGPRAGLQDLKNELTLTALVGYWPIQEVKTWTVQSAGLLNPNVSWKVFTEWPGSYYTSVM